MHTKELKSDQLGAGRRSVLSCLVSDSNQSFGSPFRKKRRKTKPNQTNPKLPFLIFLLSIKLKTPSTYYPEQLPEAPPFDSTLPFRKTHDRIPDGEILGWTLSSPQVSESTPPEMCHSLSWAVREALDGCRTLWPYDNKPLWMGTLGLWFWEANINEEGPFRDDMNWIKCPPF